jgi:hypothetical protein
MESHPEIFGRAETDEDGGTVRQQALPYPADFIICRDCENKTLHISLDERTVATREDAEELTRDGGFTCIREVELLGDTSVEDLQRAEASLREHRSS